VSVTAIILDYYINCYLKVWSTHMQVSSNLTILNAPASLFPEATSFFCLTGYLTLSTELPNQLVSTYIKTRIYNSENL